MNALVVGKVPIYNTPSISVALDSSVRLVMTSKNVCEWAMEVNFC